MPPVTIVFTPNSPQQQFQINPDPVHVPYGPGQVVTWNLTGPSGTTFATNGISFKDASPGTLTRVSDSQFQLSDDNDNQSGQEVDYPYSVAVTYNGQPYSHDPEVGNDPGSGLRIRYKAPK